VPSPESRPEVVEQAAQREAQALRESVTRAVRVAADALHAMQAPEGYWCGKLTADATLESDYILLELWLHQPGEGAWNPPSAGRIRKAVRAIRERQLSDGGWNIYAGGPSEVNATVRAYTAMKIAGVATTEPMMQRARERALALGGLQACNSYTKINFSLFDLYPRQYVPSVPPEILLVPGNILYEMSSWTRSIIVPLSVVQACGGTRATPRGMRVDELLHSNKKFALPKRDAAARVFHYVDRFLKVWERRNVTDVRKAAVREAEHWILDRTRYTDGLGAIYPAMMYTIMAFDALGYPDDHPDLVEAIRQFDNLMMETEDKLQFQPAVSPVWDTAIAMFALGELGVADSQRLTRAADWLLDKEVRRRGDWSVKRPDLTPGGWAFEFANEYYPDIDDTAMVLLGLLHAQASDPARQRRVEERAIQWLLGMQSSDGGWAAFDVDNNWSLLNKVPFADHNAMLDPTCPDITGRVIESLVRRGFGPEHAAIRRGVEYLLQNQGADGSWYGRWGVNYIYGTFLAIRGLACAGGDGARPAIMRAAGWVRSVQNADGGWGETCASYVRHSYVAGPSTASQTAWALLGLAAAGDTSSRAYRRGLQWLLDRQNADGTWDEAESTGTGFPNVFYLIYHMYRQYFPLLALRGAMTAPGERSGIVAASGPAS
jgi:squalene-hopene/tetraprenyl-beta-curcumene cyclase